MAANEPDHDAPTEAITPGETRPISVEVLGAYRLLNKLGEGGYGAVFRASHPVLGEVALKVMKRGGAVELQQFVREGTLVLDHPGIPRILDHGEVDGMPFLAQELVMGRTLAALVEGGPLPEARALDMTRRIAEVLAYTHARAIVHRDLKPQNVLVDDDDDIHVLDFGIARIRSLSDVHEAGATVGTPAFMAPEQARGEAVDGRADLYSLGAILYYLLTGHLPFVAETPMALLAAVVHAQPTPITRFRSDLKPGTRALVERLLEKAPDDRPQSAAELARELEQLRAGLPGGRGHSELGRALQGAGGMVLILGVDRARVVEDMLDAARGFGFGILHGVARVAGGAHHVLDEALRAVPELPARPNRGSVLDAYCAAVEARCGRGPQLLLCEELDRADDGSVDVLEALGHRVSRLPLLIVVSAAAERGELSRLVRASMAVGCLYRRRAGDPEGAPLPEPDLDVETCLAQAQHAQRVWALRLALLRYRQVAVHPGASEALRLKALTQQGGLRRGMGDHEAAIEALGPARDLAERLGDRLQLGQVLRELAIVHLERGEGELALTELQSAVEIMREVGARSLEGACENSIGTVYRILSDFPNAVLHLERAREIFDELGDRERCASTLSNLAVLLVEQGLLVEGRAAQEAALAIWRECGDHYHESTALVNLGSALFELGELLPARRCYEEALDIRRRLGELRPIASALVSLGALMRADGELETARATTEEALAIARRIEQPALVAVCLEHLASQLREEGGAPAEAWRLAEESLALRRELGDRSGEAMTLNLQGLLLHGEGRCDEAQRRFEAAHALAESLGMKVLLASVLKDRGSCLAGSGSEQGLELLDEAIAEATRLGAGTLELEARLDRAQALASRGALDEARAIARDVIATAHARHRRALVTRATRFWESLR